MLFHLCLLTVVSQYSHLPVSDSFAFNASIIELTLTKNDVQYLDVLPLENLPDEAIQDKEQQFLPSDANMATVATVTQALESVQTAEVVLQIENEDIPFNDTVNAVLDALQQQTTVNTTDEAAFSPEALESIISNFLSTHRANLGREAIEQCMKYKIRYGKSDCPQFATPFTPTTRDGEQSQALLNDMEFLKGLMKGDSIASESARDFYYIKDEEYVRLNGGGGDNFMLSTTDNVIAGDPVLGLISTDGKSLSLLGGLVNIGLDGKINFFNDDIEITLPELTDGVGYTTQDDVGDNIEENTQEDEVNSRPNFEVATPLFQTR